MIDPLTAVCPACLAAPGTACWNKALPGVHTKHTHRERVQAVYPSYPCPVYVKDTKGIRRYCDQGERGHSGTCNGSKRWTDYVQERERISKQRREARAAA